MARGPNLGYTEATTSYVRWENSDPGFSLITGRPGSSPKVLPDEVKQSIGMDVFRKL